MISENNLTYKTASLDKLKNWIIDKNQNIETIDDDKDILESGLISSFEFISFLLFIEEIRGREIDAEQVKRESFTTLNIIYETFLREYS